MKPSPWEIVILKPTSVFLTFLASQLNGVKLPDIKLLQTDNTAYVIKKQQTDEDTLREVERLYPTMFRHEICRWLGKEARNEIEGSFLDFLCCFKFELHSHLVLMEKTISDGNQLLRIRPRSILLKWMRSAIEDETDLTAVLDRINLTHLAENATVVIKNFAQLAAIKPFLKTHYQTIFEAEMNRMCDRPEQWPDVDSYQAFCRYFAIDIHTQLVHLH